MPDIASMRIKIGADASGVGRATKMAGAAFAALAAVAIAAAAKAARAAGEQERAYSLLANRIGTAAANEFAEFAAQLQKVTTVGDEAAMTAATVGASFGLTGKKLQDATAIAADMAATYGMDLNAAMRVVGQGLTGQISMLGRYVPALKGAKFETLGYEGVLSELTKAFDGSAKAAADNYLGSVDQLNNVFGDITEKVGQGYTPVLKELNTVLKEQAEEIDSNADMWKTWGEEAKAAALVTVDIAAFIVSMGGKAVQVGQATKRAAKVVRLSWEVAAEGLSAAILVAFSKVVTSTDNTVKAIVEKLNELPKVDIKPPKGLSDFAKTIETEAAAQLDSLDEKLAELTAATTGFDTEWQKTGKTVTGTLGILADLRGRIAALKVILADLPAKTTGVGAAASEAASAFGDYTSAIDAFFAKGERIKEQQLEKTFEAQAAAQKQLQMSIAQTTLSMISQAAAGRLTAKQLIAQLAGIAAAEAARWAFTTSGFAGPAAFGIAAAAAVAAGALVSALDSFHSGGIVGPDSGIRMPGMADDERAVKVRVGEEISPRPGGNVTITFNQNIPSTQAELDRHVRDVIWPSLRRIGAVS